MKIKTKLVISFCIILFVPIVLSCVVVFGFQTIQVKAIEKAYGIHDAGAYSLTNSIQLLNRMTESDFASAQRIDITISCFSPADSLFFGTSSFSEFTYLSSSDVGSISI